MENAYPLVVPGVDIGSVRKQKLQDFPLEIHVEKVDRLEPIFIDGGRERWIRRKHGSYRRDISHMDGLMKFLGDFGVGRSG
nr:hypothetical protein [Rhizobium leguminosarum]